MSVQKVTEHPIIKQKFLNMQPLVTIYQMLEWLCVCPPEKAISWRKHVAYISLISSIFIACVTIMAMSLSFVIENLAVDLEKSLYALAQFVGYVGETYMIILVLLLRHRITGLFKKLSQIYKDSKHICDFFFLEI